MQATLHVASTVDLAYDGTATYSADTMVLPITSNLGQSLHDLSSHMVRR